MGPKNHFAIRLKALREEKKLNQGQLASEIGISRGSISFYENGDRTPDIEILCRMADFFDVDCDYLLGISNLKKSKNKDVTMINEMGVNDNSINKIINIKKKYENFLVPVNPVNILFDDDGYLPYIDNFFDAIINFLQFEIHEKINLKFDLLQDDEINLIFSDKQKPIEQQPCVLLTGSNAANYFLHSAQKYLNDILHTYATDCINLLVDHLKLMGVKSGIEQEINYAELFEQLRKRSGGIDNGNSTKER